MSQPVSDPAVSRVDHAADLPRDWDQHASSYFQQREFLLYAETYNFCRQRYYFLRSNTGLSAGCIVYTLRLDLFTFAGIRSPVTMHILGVPIGTSTAGYFGEPDARAELVHRVSRLEHGMLVTLNSDPADRLNAGIRCRMLPTICFDNRFRDWQAYLSALRYPHRRRTLRIRERSEQYSRIVTDCSAFSELHYSLYRNVHDRASAKLETLTRDFFLRLPDRFRLNSYYDGSRLISWTITVNDGRMFMYFFGGMDYSDLVQTGAYFTGLADIVRDCIAGGYPLLDLGQTAAEPKLRFGCRIVPKVMYLNHHNRIIMMFFGLFRPLLEFREDIPEFHVFNTVRP